MTDSDATRKTAIAAIEEGETSFSRLLALCLDETSLAEEAAAKGVEPYDFLIWLLEVGDQVLVREEDDRVILYDDLLDGVVLTHRLDENEIGSGLVSATPDLLGIEIDLDPVPLAAGGTANLQFNRDGDTRYHEEGSFEGPEGWLDGFRPGDLVAFARRGGSLVLEATAEVADPSPEVAALSASFQALVDRPGIGAEPSEILLEALDNNPDLFRSSLPPLGEILALGGLEVRGGWAGPKGEEWKPPGVARLDDLTRQIEASYDMDACCVEAFRAAIDHWRDPAGADSVAAAKALGHGVVAGAFLEWYDGFLGVESSAFGEYLRDLISGSGRHAAPVRYLHAVHLDAIGEALAAEAELDTVTRLDPDDRSALWMLAGYSADRGDAARAISLFQSAGVGPDDPDLEFLRSLAEEVPDVGRNDPCPCGSGRKFKVCHLNNPTVTPQKRIEWMLNKVIRYMHSHRRHDRYYDMALAASVGLSGEPTEEGIRRMAGEEFIFELEMFEEGGLSDFLTERWEMLPKDERDIYELWARATLALWEVKSTSDGTVELRDTLTGDVVEVLDRSTAEAFEPGDMMLARPVPGFGAMWLSGVALSIDLRNRETLLELFGGEWEGWHVANWYGSLYRPPVLQTREGEPLVFCEATVVPAATWEGLEEKLDQLYERDEDGGWISLGPEESLGGNLIRATLAREGDHLVVYAQAVERLDRVLNELDGVVEVLERKESEIDWDSLPRDTAPQERPEIDPAIRSEIVEMLEDRWLDEEVPALGGITPREAAADPTRLEDLESLLRTFQRIEGADPAMRASSLRRKLGLEDR